MGLGIRIVSCDPADDFITLATFAEKYGFASFWVSEYYHYKGMFTLMGAVAQATSKIPIGTTVVSPYTRHPCVIAMEMSALDELSNRRATLSLGLGRRYALYRHGMAEEDIKGLTAVRESLQIIKGLFAGQIGNFEGKVFKARNVPFRSLHKNIPVYVAGIKPRMLRLAGELGDGISLTPVGPPNYIKFALEEVKKGAAKAKRDVSKIDVAQGVMISVSDDYDDAMASARRTVAHVMAGGGRDLGTEEIILEHEGVKQDEVDDIAKAYKKGGVEEAARELSEDTVRIFIIVGDPQACVKGIKERIDLGVEKLAVRNVSPMQRGNHPIEKANSWRLISDYILPELQGTN
jgi:5,10-methylenetetrahydromethanopterin reductase